MRSEQEILSQINKLEKELAVQSATADTLKIVITAVLVSFLLNILSSTAPIY